MSLKFVNSINQGLNFSTIHAYVSSMCKVFKLSKKKMEFNYLDANVSFSVSKYVIAYIHACIQIKVTNHHMRFAWNHLVDLDS